MRIFAVSSSVLPNAQAHPIQILQTARALAARPDVEEVELWFLALEAGEKAIWAQYGMDPPAGVRLRALFPGLLARLAGGRGRLDPSRRMLHRWALGRLRRALARQARSGSTVLLTRSQGLLPHLAPFAQSVGVPVLMELHWLKSVDHFRSWKDKAARRKGSPPPLSQCKARLREERGRERDALRLADGVICLTCGLQEKIASWNLERPLFHLPSGVDPKPFEHARQQADVRRAEPGFDLAYAGQLYPWKGVDTLICAMAHLPALRLALIGGNDPGDIERVRRLARELGVLDRIRFFGQVPHAEVPAVLQQSRICVLPLPRSGFIEARMFTSPLKLFEYAAAGRVIVASDLPSVREALEHGKNGWLVPPDDPEALARGIRILLEKGDLMARLAAGARELARAHSYAERARRLAEFAGTFLGKVRPGSAPAALPGRAEAGKGDQKQSGA